MWLYASSSSLAPLSMASPALLLRLSERKQHLLTGIPESFEAKSMKIGGIEYMYVCADAVLERAEDFLRKEGVKHTYVI